MYYCMLILLICNVIIFLISTEVEVLILFYIMANFMVKSPGIYTVPKIAGQK